MDPEGWVPLTVEFNLFWEADICLHAVLRYSLPFYYSVNEEIFFEEEIAVDWVFFFFFFILFAIM